MVSNSDEMRKTAMRTQARLLSPAQRDYLIRENRLPQCITNDPRRLDAQLNYVIRLHNDEIESQESRRRMTNGIENSFAFSPQFLLPYSPLYLHAQFGRIVTPVIHLDGYVTAQVIDSCSADRARVENNHWTKDVGGKTYSYAGKKELRLSQEDLERVVKNRGLAPGANGIYE